MFRKSLVLMAAVSAALFVFTGSAAAAVSTPGNQAARITALGHLVPRAAGYTLEMDHTPEQAAAGLAGSWEGDLVKDSVGQLMSFPAETDPKINDQKVLVLAVGICRALNSGMTKEDLNAELVRQAAGGLSADQTGQVIGKSVAALCPELMGKARLS